MAANRIQFFGGILQARFLKRPNRFLVVCNCNGRTVHAFLPNPGRLQELLLPGRGIYQLAEKIIFLRLLKNGQMQGPRNSEE